LDIVAGVDGALLINRSSTDARVTPKR